MSTTDSGDSCSSCSEDTIDFENSILAEKMLRDGRVRYYVRLGEKLDELRRGRQYGTAQAWALRLERDTTLPLGIRAYCYYFIGAWPSPQVREKPMDYLAWAFDIVVEQHGRFGGREDGSRPTWETYLPWMILKAATYRADDDTAGLVEHLVGDKDPREQEVARKEEARPEVDLFRACWGPGLPGSRARFEAALERFKGLAGADVARAIRMDIIDFARGKPLTAAE